MIEAVHSPSPEPRTRCCDQSKDNLGNQRCEQCPSTAEISIINYPQLTAPTQVSRETTRNTSGFEGTTSTSPCVLTLASTDAARIAEPAGPTQHVSRETSPPGTTAPARLAPSYTPTIWVRARTPPVSQSEITSAFRPLVASMG